MAKRQQSANDRASMNPVKVTETVKAPLVKPDNPEYKLATIEIEEDVLIEAGTYAAYVNSYGEFWGRAAVLAGLVGERAVTKDDKVSELQAKIAKLEAELKAAKAG